MLTDWAMWTAVLAAGLALVVAWWPTPKTTIRW
jgi:hypothetical protein